MPHRRVLDEELTPSIRAHLEAEEARHYEEVVRPRKNQYEANERYLWACLRGGRGAKENEGEEAGAHRQAYARQIQQGADVAKGGSSARNTASGDGSFTTATHARNGTQFMGGRSGPGQASSLSQLQMAGSMAGPSHSRL